MGIAPVNFATLDLNLLRVLDALLSEGSTIRAGEKLGLSQSAVSGALSRLREALQDPLFIRQGNRLVATPFAEGLALPLKDELDRLRLLLAPRARFDPAAATGRFRITASDFFAEMLMPALAQTLHRKAPGLTAHLVDLVPSDYVQSLERYNADLALIPDTDLPGWIAREPLFHSSFAVIARAGHPAIATRQIEPDAVLPIDLFCDLGHVLFSPEGNMAAMGDAALARLGRKRHVALTVPVFSGVCRAVSETDLIALIPRQLAERVARQFALTVYRPPLHITPPLIIACWHKRQNNSPLHGWLRQELFALLRPLNAGEYPTLRLAADPG